MLLSPLSGCSLRNYTKSIFFVYLCTTISFIYSPFNKFRSQLFLHRVCPSRLDTKPRDSGLLLLHAISDNLGAFLVPYLYFSELMTSQTLNLHTDKSSYDPRVMVLCGAGARKQLTTKGKRWEKIRMSLASK